MPVCSHRTFRMHLQKTRDAPGADRLLRVELQACAAGVWTRHGVWSVVIAIDLLVKVLGVERAGRTGNAGNQQQSNKCGRDGLHGYLPLILINPRCTAGESVSSIV